MKILAIDSSGLVASVALYSDGIMLAEYTVDYKKTHSQTLLPMIDEIVKMTEQDLHTIDAIATAKGPGSFTGLRIGAATAKGLGLALDKPLIGIPTVEGLAYNIYGFQGLICPLMDARRNQVYTGLFENNANGFHRVLEQTAVAIEEIILKINEIKRPVIYLGDGVVPYREELIEKTRVPYSFAPPHLMRQHAGSVAALAVSYFLEGKTEKAGEHQPEYLRLSQAERERLEKET